jgi:hypothetical protein
LRKVGIDLRHYIRVRLIRVRFVERRVQRLGIRIRRRRLRFGILHYDSEFTA